jgi:hypothetical protein
MKQSSIWEANIHLAGQEIPCLLWEPGGLILCSQEPTTSSYPEPH